MAFNKKPGIVVLTGAGISAESGIRTFRDAGGLWENHRVEDVASPEGFARDPEMVWRFYKDRYYHSLQALPNPGHLALVKLEQVYPDNFTLITQNVDGLHRHAGSRKLYEMHGRLRTALCSSCTLRHDMASLDLEPLIPLCPSCGGKMRPDIVWFGEIPYYLDEIEEALQDCVLMLVIGTSGVVYPAAGFVMTAKYFGARTIGVNFEKPEQYDVFDEFYQGKAGEVLPGLVNRLIERGIPELKV